MRHFLQIFACMRLVRCQRAATAVEYGLILALIFLVMSIALRQVATKTTNMWGNVANAVNNS
ncbi:MAG: Flp family type IVb pilin [Sphingobium phenoxybenzoativorans]|uniref:Flp family type IVb pilin n=1 Tax=Sphingobium phenoxybenzoativorans TaxID=1592790 RepID=A0A975K4X4_9SPHN|nr:Flp family type IVb pilin [Sphingobium phenoxybenzoativorans]QUT04577.1 Flp family type IVb pilin [Sphingobium phenoxybenzoativorans]